MRLSFLFICVLGLSVVGCEPTDCCRQKYPDHSTLGSKLLYECVVGSSEIGPKSPTALRARQLCGSRHSIELSRSFDENSYEMSLLSACDLGAEAYLVANGKEKVDESIASCKP